MPRISELTPTDFDVELAQLYKQFTGDGAQFSDQFSILAHVRPAALHLFSMLSELKARENISYRYIELAVVVVSLLNECQYCVDNHAPRLEVDGISEQGARNLLDYQGHPELTPVDKLVVEYAIAVTQSAARIPEKLFDRLRSHFTEDQIVELTLRISLCGFFNRFNQALQVGEDTSAVHVHANIA
ncbi:putative peroxidase-related enzyme [Herbaspirillum sp. Sphag1AN]|uniref:carboxymuconolactone decarboxylase family protein n=1 Tax=unclassified Herbaspirillum TaxID=2624150 RepID=UPI00160752F5|nr:MULTISPECIES: carboxymuconolactone decarboxylase family protein [unclassified Herbaspirillum]MBB3211838.1 putative peroxidase-related enzyme [Herbaspirillum sp. Sphag1AN]MBB3244328.1 putative peroxidase-related enzyme [Herbaspirillum sp. Sphag64]